jgi:hypothetical protein
MKKQHKELIRHFLLAQLEHEDIRLMLDSWLDAEKTLKREEIEDLEAIEFYEQEVQRIRKLFCLWDQRPTPQDTATTHLGRMMR